jgi:acetyltransferase-like isoleucine patch superfamily enzyme
MINRYGLLGIFKLIFSWLFTKLYFKNARLVRLPIDIRNKHLIDFGSNLTTGKSCRIEAYNCSNNLNTKLLIFGNNIQLNDFVHISAGGHVKIGNNVLIASKVFISDINHGIYDGLIQDSPYLKPVLRKLSTKPVTIGDNVWIGEGVCILPGVKIGNGCIIGALSVVTKSFPDNTIIVGNPAKTIKIYDEKLLKWVSTL